MTRYQTPRRMKTQKKSTNHKYALFNTPVFHIIPLHPPSTGFLIHAEKIVPNWVQFIQHPTVNPSLHDMWHATWVFKYLHTESYVHNAQTYHPERKRKTVAGERSISNALNGRPLSSSASQHTSPFSIDFSMRRESCALPLYKLHTMKAISPLHSKR